MATATIFDGLDLRVETRQARIGVIGMGYMGLPLGLLFSAERFTVTGFDTDRSKVDRLLAGGSYIACNGSAEIVDAQAHGFSATDDYRKRIGTNTSSVAPGYVVLSSTINCPARR